MSSLKHGADELVVTSNISGLWTVLVTDYF